MEFGNHARAQQQIKLNDPKLHFMSPTTGIKYEHDQWLQHNSVNKYGTQSHADVIFMGGRDGYEAPHISMYCLKTFFLLKNTQKKTRCYTVKVSSVNSFSSIAHTKISCLGTQRDVCNLKALAIVSR